MIDAFLSRYGLRGLRAGSPLLSILEAAAQSDLRSTQDIFNLLDSLSLDRATGVALDRKAADEDIIRLSVSPSSGTVVVYDTSFSKVETKIYQGAAAPNAGTQVIRVSDASTFPSTGSIYIGRGTVNVEGPIAYTSVTPTGNYWTIALSAATLKFHDTGEAVVLAKGGDRVVPAGTVVRTTHGGVSVPITFSTLSAVTIPDGEISADGVGVVCQQPGVIGNVAKNAICEFTSPPFEGAAVTNLQPLDNGQAAEDDASLRERIRDARQSRAKGTALALITNAKGVRAADENKTVLSASLFTPNGEPATLFIDDGTGYEEMSDGVAIDPLVNQAVGGEQYLRLGGPLPVTKAFAVTTLTAPFELSGGATLAVKVAGVLSEHSFSGTEFKSISNATAYEIVSSINANPKLLFSARTANNGTKVVVFARSELNEDIEVVTPDIGTNANQYLGFTGGVNYTLRLYKNDVLLYKDGKKAIVTTAPQNDWAATIANGVYVKVKVDDTKARVYKIVDQDFVDAGTGYVSVDASNALEAWAAVFNAKIPGITCLVTSGRLQFVSNRGTSSAAAIVISEPVGGDKDVDGVTVSSISNNLVKLGMFNSLVGLSAAGRSNDYTLNKNTGEIKLTAPIATNDTVSAGTEFTRAYLQGAVQVTGTVTFAGAASLWVVMDGAASLISTSVTSGTAFNVTAPAGSRRRYTTSNAVFQNVKRGDWMVLWDPAFTVRGAWRVSSVDPAFKYVEVERENPHVNQNLVAPSSSGMVFVRTDNIVQQINLSAGANRSLASIATEINASLLGGTASVFRNKYLRITTDTFGANGDIFVAAANLDGQQLGFALGKRVSNTSSHIAAIENQNAESGTPTFAIGSVATLPGILGETFTVAGITYKSGDLVRFLRRKLVGGTEFGNLVGFWTPVKSVSGNTVTPRNVVSTAIVGDRIVATSPYSIGPYDTLGLILDGNFTTKNYNVPMWRKIKPVAGQSYTATALQVVDVDNANSPLSNSFGTSDADFFRDFAVYMNARAKSHAGGNNVPLANYHHNKAILWRYGRMGAEGNAVRVSYVNPSGPNQPITLTTKNGQYSDIQIGLPSDIARTGLNLYGTTRFSTTIVVGAPADTLTFSAYRPSVSLTRNSNVVSGTTGVAHGYAVGDIVYITSGDPNFPSGAKVITDSVGNLFKYNETGPNVVVASVQTADSAPVAPDFTNVQIGDVVSIASSTGFAASNTGVFRVYAKTATTFSVAVTTGTATAEASKPLNSATGLRFYPIKTAASKASDIVTWVNANTNGLITAVAIENGGGAPGTGTIGMSTRDEYFLGYGNSTGGTPVSSWSLADGINYVLSSNLAVSPNTITLKNSVSADLVTDSDFDNESIRLVPICVEGVVRYLSSPAVSGFYAGSEIVASTQNSKLQLSSASIGSRGSIQVTGGTANSTSILVVGAGSVVDTTYSKVTVASNQATGLTGGQWVAVQGSGVQQKSVPITSGSSLQTIALNGSNWKVSFDGGTSLWSSRYNINTAALIWEVDKVGRFAVYYCDTVSFPNVIEGDWVRIVNNSMSTSNTGVFRVVRKLSDNKTFWVENPNAVSEKVQTASGDYVEFYPYDSVMPGDQLVLDTDIFGASNRGTFTVVNTTGGTSNTVTVSGSMTAFSGGGALGANSTFVRFVEASPVRLIKQISAIGQTPSSNDYLDVVFNTSALASKMNSSAGAAIQPLDKLGFSTELVSGADAYSYAKGLIGEVTRVLYGDPANPSIYPGVVAAGAQVNVSGPLVKRISVGLAIRVMAGADVSSIVNLVKSAAASAVNRVQIGRPVALSSIVSAAAGVGGVLAVTVTSPTYNSGNDLIAVQANEKPRVLDPDNDVVVSVVGV